MESGLCVGKLQGSLRPLKERYNSTCLPRSWDQESLTSLGYTKARRAQTAVMRKGLIFGEELPGTCCRLQMAWGPNAPNIPKNPKETFPKNQRERKRGVNPPGCISTPVVGKPGQETTIPRLLRLQIPKCVHCNHEHRFRWMERLASSKGEDGP